MAKDVINYMGHLWITISGDEVTVGINEDGIEAIDDIKKILLPEQGEEFESDDVCGEIETSDGPLNLYAPVTGSISEINAAVIQEPELILEDPFDEGWLFKIEAKDSEEVAQLKGADFEN